MSTTLPDIQRTRDTRKVFINQVGVTRIKMPVRLLRRPGKAADGQGTLPDKPETCDTVGEFELSCSLGHEIKGTHMSRFTEVLQSHIDASGIFSHENLQKVARELAAKMDSYSVRLRMTCDYFVPQDSPVTSKRGIAPLKAVLEVSFYRNLHKPSGGWCMKCSTGIEIDGKTCCPCSREISDFDETTGRGKGAHAQRGTVTINVKHSANTVIWFEELVEVCFAAFSSPVYPVLKRPDERHVTMAAYANPKFVEDVIRDVVVGLRALIKDPFALWKVRVQNAESIHYHDAFAEVEGGPASDIDDEDEDKS